MRKTIVIAALGGMLEYYDYTLFIILMPLIAPLFFPHVSEYHAIQESFYLLFISAIARPIGAFFFGYIGDYVGRKAALMISITGITIATFAIASTPTYSSIGFSAIVLLAIFRAIQMFCYSSEIIGSGIYVIETTTKTNHGLLSSSIYALSFFGGIVGTIITFICIHYNFSWRIPFIVGGVLGLLAIKFRNNLYEPKIPKATAKDGFKQILKKYPLQVSCGFLLGIMGIIISATITTFINPILIAKHVFTKPQFIAINSLYIFSCIIMLLITGIISDKLGIKTTIYIGLYATLIAAFPAFWLIERQTIPGILSGELIVLLINMLILGTSLAYLRLIFPAQYRYRGGGIGMALGLSLTNATTPIIDNQIYSQIPNLTFTALLPISVAIIAILVLRKTKEIRVG